MNDIITKALHADPDGAAALMDEVVYSMLAEEAAALAPVLDRIALHEAHLTVRKAKAGLAKGYVAKAAAGDYPGADVMTTARYLAGIENWLTEVSKFEIIRQRNKTGGTYQQRIFRDSLGRFAPISGTPANVVGNKKGTAGTLASPVEARVAPDDKDQFYVAADPDAKDKKQIAAFQGQFLALQSQVDSAATKLGAAAAGVTVTVRMEDGTEHMMSLTDAKAGKFPTGTDVANPPKEFKFEAANPAGAKALADAHLNRMGLAGRLLSGDKFESGGAYGQAFGTRPEDMTRAEAFFSRLKIAGELLNESDATKKYGQWVALTGTLGPEAMTVAEPHIRRAAYRYRGTERTPEQGVMLAVNGPNGQERVYLDAAAKHLDSGGTELGIKDKGADATNPLKQSIANRQAKGWVASGDSLKMGVRSDMVAAELLRTLPKDKRIAALSSASGHVLPSQGVLIDADGDVVSQSVGFTDDHYLPFNLNNLKRLRGGQYVRTRQQGGLTGEDIWASVAHGARSATVASRSGVTRIEFAPDFRGARAMSDKAMSMYDRYLQILNTISDEDNPFYMQDLSPEQRNAVETKVRRLNPNADAKTLKTAIDAAAKIERVKLSAPLDEAALRRQAETEVDRTINESTTTTSARARAVEDTFRELRDKAIKERPATLNLNGEGYYMALKTLAQQFPYFIRSVEFEPLVGPDDNTSNDRQPVFGAAREGNGFYGARGMRTPSGLSPSRSADAGYVPKGKLLRGDTGGSAWFTSGDASSAAPGGAPPAPGGAPGGAPGSSDAPDASKAPVPPAPDVDTSSPAAAMAADKGRLTETGQAEMTRKFVAEMLKFSEDAKYTSDTSVNGGERKAGDTVLLNGRYAKMTWEEAREDPQSEMSWFFALNRDGMKKALVEHSAELYDTFAHAEVADVTAALSHTWEHPEHGWDDIVASRRPFGTDDVTEVSTALRTQAMAILEAQNLIEPFTEVDPSAFSTQSTKAFSFSDITSLHNAGEVETFTEDATNSDVVSAGALLGLRPDGSYDSFKSTSLRTKVALKGLARVGSLQALTEAGSESVGAAVSRELASLATDTGFAEERLKELITQGGDIAPLYETVQRGRTLVEVSRVYDMSGGGERPKARPAWGPAKTVGKARSFPRVLSSADPVSKAVAARRAANLPWVPRRRTH